MQSGICAYDSSSIPRLPHLGAGHQNSSHVPDHQAIGFQVGSTWPHILPPPARHRRRYARALRDLPSPSPIFLLSVPSCCTPLHFFSSGCVFRGLQIVFHGAIPNKKSRSQLCVAVLIPKQESTKDYYYANCLPSKAPRIVILQICQAKPQGLLFHVFPKQSTLFYRLFTMVSIVSLCWIDLKPGRWLRF